MSIRTWSIIVAVVVLITTTMVFSQTYVQGNVSGDWYSSGNPYIVQDDITVPIEQSLTIHPGVEVYFLDAPISGMSFTIYGGLYVEGTLMEPVIFAAHESNEDGWNIIKFEDEAADDSEINFAEIYDSFGGVFVYRCDANVTNSKIQGESRGLRLMYADGEFSDNLIEASFLTSTGILMHSSDAEILRNKINVTGTNFMYYSFGIDANRCDYAVINSNIISVDGEGATFGILFDNCEHIEITYNLVEAFSDYVSYGIFMTYSFDPMLRSNTIKITSTSVNKGIYFADSDGTITNNIVVGDGGGGGIYCDQTSDPDISYNDIWNHSINYEGCEAGEGDISEDPQFIGGNPFSYHLKQTSPCRDTGNPRYTDPDDTRSDMGAYPYMKSYPTPDGIVPCPFRTILGTNYPNPFNPKTIIPLSVSQHTHVSVEVFNVMGQRVAHLFQGQLDAGDYKVTWNASTMPSGIYFCRVRAGNIVNHRKMILQK